MMRKLGILILLCLLLTAGCGKHNKLVDDYYKKVETLKNYSDFEENKDFIFTLTVDKLTEDEIQYRLILDTPKEIMNNIQLLLIHNQKTEDIFPSIGLFDDRISLIPDSFETKGLILVGYLPFSEDVKDFHADFRIFLEYQDSNNNTIQKYYLIQK